MNASIVLVIASCLFAQLVLGQTYSVSAIKVDTFPVLSYLDHSSTYYQAFNPSWVNPTSMQPRSGLLVRAQNCSTVPGECPYCPGSSDPSVILFAEQVTSEPNPTFEPVSEYSIAFEPETKAEIFGTEDPRLALLPNGTYILFYTQYGQDDDNNTIIRLSTATTTDPTDKDSWTRHGPVFPGQYSKSGALIVTDSPPYYLLWGDNNITIAVSEDLITWKNLKVMISPRPDSFDSKLVESGPPPMKLSTGDWLFFHNSANESTAYHPGWLILSGADPTQILARSEEPLLTPDSLPWAIGEEPYLCNVPNVVFLEAAHRVDWAVDTFRVYFGGADTVIGTAIIQVTYE